ncbi:hypothetical protein AFI02nite_17140 [Aliivibrio fischeri]|uniref:Uncharacterized protein n=1 Tax=Aliivibrio fischeri TaxID=668 RepID=A0A510UGC1_ALIFS|nr:hypothetical protein AFI02nite_17140 [Aliivibrio fischeri]
MHYLLSPYKNKINNMSSITETVETYAFYKIKANKGVKNGTNYTLIPATYPLDHAHWKL